MSLYEAKQDMVKSYLNLELITSDWVKEGQLKDIIEQTRREVFEQIFKYLQIYRSLNGEAQKDQIGSKIMYLVQQFPLPSKAQGLLEEKNPDLKKIKVTKIFEIK